MHTAPNGKIPPSAIAKAGWVYHICSGTCLQRSENKETAERQSLHSPHNEDMKSDKLERTSSQGSLRSAHWCFRKCRAFTTQFDYANLRLSFRKLSTGADSGLPFAKVKVAVSGV